MQQVVLYTLYGTAIGVFGTAAGGALAYTIQSRGKRLLGFVMEFSGGVMLAVVSFELLPEAFGCAPLWVILSGFGTGVLVILVSEWLLGDRHESYLTRQGLLVTSLTMAIGIAAHNLPEGLAIGAGFGGSAKLGISLAVTIGVHNIPEGLSLVLPMRLAKKPIWYGVGLAGLAGLPTGLGAWIGAAVGTVSQDALGWCLGMAAGAMLYVVLGSLLPKVRYVYEGRLSGIGSVLGMIFGIVLSVGLG